MSKLPFHSSTCGFLIGRFPDQMSVRDENNEQQILRVLGEGAFGEVLLVRKGDKGPLVAVKVMDMKRFTSSDDIKTFKKEAAIQQHLSNPGHANVLRYIGKRVDEAKKVFELYLEYADGGELFDRIEPDVGIRENKAQFYFRQLINGLEFIHGYGVTHRDIKPENLFLTKTDVLKIGDFGLATIYKNNGKEREMTMPCGTMPYASPQVISSKYKGLPTDVWSAGVVLHVMLTGELAWEKAHWQCPRYTSWLERALIEPWNNIDSSALDLLYEMLCESEDQRATFETIRSHKWYNKEFGDDEPSKKRVRITGSQPTFGTENGFGASETKIQMQPVPAMAFSQPHNILLLTQEYDHSINPLANMNSRLTRFCVDADYATFAERLQTACEEMSLEVKEKPPHQLMIFDHVQGMTMAVSVFEMFVGGQKRFLVDFRRSTGCGMTMKRTFLDLRRHLFDLICSDATTTLEVGGLKICE
ncbi:unnamed protein product, partial [Mesorhabditis belari]|uniref:non-specific serine/threonine protein kinase n=1 Tax=Mesorhabditis belari TaxID=2138241 RepID=A0AAF3EX96_9BILA